MKLLSPLCVVFIKNRVSEDVQHAACVNTMLRDKLNFPR